MSEGCISRVECKTCQDKYDEINNSQNRRLDALEADIKQIHSLTVSVEKMAISLEAMAKELEKQGQKLDALESEPGKNWKQATWLIFTVLITAAITYILTSIGVK